MASWMPQHCIENTGRSAEDTGNYWYSLGPPKHIYDYMIFYTVKNGNICHQLITKNSTANTTSNPSSNPRACPPAAATGRWWPSLPAVAAAAHLWLLRGAGHRDWEYVVWGQLRQAQVGQGAGGQAQGHIHLVVGWDGWAGSGMQASRVMRGHIDCSRGARL